MSSASLRKINSEIGTNENISSVAGESFFSANAPLLRKLENLSAAILLEDAVIKTKIDETFGSSMVNEERKKLATLIYYPEEKLKLIKNEVKDLNEYYKITLYRLISICRIVASKYSRSKVRKAMPKGYEYILDELLHANKNVEDKELYYNQIIDSIIKIKIYDNQNKELLFIL